MVVRMTGFARCDSPERYVKQLVSHWGHKMPTSYDAVAKAGTFPFSEHESAIVSATDDGMAITLDTGDPSASERLRTVLERHLDRFAFRESPLDYEWRRAE